MSEANVLGILQARTTSSRLPGKVLADLHGQPMILRHLERLQRARNMDAVMVATSDDPSDDELAAVLRTNKIPVFRGDLNDVLGRFIGVSTQEDPEVIVRLTADCPLASPAVIDRVIDEFLRGDFDYASNTLNPTFPDGIDVEVVRATALAWVDQYSVDRHEREHVTLGVYRRPDVFNLLSVRADVDHSALRWTVDEQGDLDFVRWVYSELYNSNPQFEYEDVLDLIRLNPSMSRTTADAVRNAALVGLDTGAMNA